MATLTNTMQSDINELIFKDLDLSKKENFKKDPFWHNLRKTGTELWLDTGDLEEAAQIYTDEMTALTTNNTLLNKEIQKGIYDDFIKEADRILEGLTTDERVMEIAFILNAHHGLRLVEKFGGKVSVELHTNLADDYDGIVEYGKRFHAISPDHFIVKVPYTATGLIGARKLRDLNIPINFTLEFSARQNALVTAIVRPNYLNVFLGRLNSYVADNELGDGNYVGEKSTLSSQRIVQKLSENNRVPTKQIAASLRNASQVDLLAGVDVFTMPTKVAIEAREKLHDGAFKSKVSEDYKVTMASGIDHKAVRIENLWEIDDKVLEFCHKMQETAPATGLELNGLARDAGLTDMFPDLSQEEAGIIAKDGKIPVHKTWADKIRQREIAIDTLLNLAGLASFTQDQKALDQRIEGLIK